jgi:hypothetical protein
MEQVSRSGLFQQEIILTVTAAAHGPQATTITHATHPTLAMLPIVHTGHSETTYSMFLDAAIRAVFIQEGIALLMAWGELESNTQRTAA